MPVRCKISKSRRLITQIGEGVVTIAEIQRNREALLKHPDFDPSFDMLWDATKAASIEASGKQMAALAQGRVLLQTSRVAFVAPQSEVFGMARMFEIYNSMREDPAQTRVFRDISEALEWLNRPR